MNDNQNGIHSNLDIFFWSLQSMEGISVGNEKMFTFPHYRSVAFAIRGQDPQMYRQKEGKKIRKCIFRSQNTSAYIIQSMQWYGTINDSMTDKTRTLRKIYMNMRASLDFCFLHILILKLQFPSIFCWYFRCFVSARQQHNFQVSNYICIHIQSMQFSFITYMAL